MRKLNVLFGLLIALTTIACSSEDDATSENEEPTRLYKKSEVYFESNLVFDKTVNYNSENNIQSIVTNDYAYRINTISVDYFGSTISSINENDDFVNSMDPNLNVSYDITFENNRITMVSDNFAVEIYHSNGYVDSTKEFNPADPSVFSEQIFTRDSNQNLISNTTGDGSTFTYTDFDADKRVDPFGSVTEYSYSDYFKIFGLKVTKSNPLTATYSQGSVVDTYSQYLEYDALGYVIRTTSQAVSATSYIEHQYIEL